MAPDRHGDASDNDLALAAARGDRRALEILLERHVDYVHAVCRRVLSHPEDALDATQEALVAVARRIGSFDGRAQFTTWLYRVATNAALDEVRRRRRRPTPAEDEVLDRTSAAVASTPSPERTVTARLDVDAALARLPEEFRTAVVLRDLLDLDYAEIAEVLDVPVGTVRSRIFRGRKALAEWFGNSPTPSDRPNVRHTDSVHPDPTRSELDPPT
jgi:RNA polymerase sigma-70 factor (ECF subfamily)